MEIGYFLSSEEYTPAQLIEQARLAEEAGFDGLWISDHFHPWNDEQGQSAFVWSMIGAVSQVCELPVTTAVTCPTVRIHPAVIAQAAATSAVLLNGRFRLGIGSGEALNEHIFGDAWPTVDVRLEMLEEAVEIIRRLWTEDGFVSHHGKHYTVDTARIYTRPDSPLPIYMSGFGPQATDLAARIADGYITTTPDKDLLQRFRTNGGGDKLTQAGFKVSYAPTEDEGIEQAHRIWGNAGLPGELSQVLPSPRHFEQASQLVTKEQTAESVTCGAKAADHLKAFEPYVEAGFDEIYVANMGPHSVDMMNLYRTEVLPELRKSAGH
ncbi:TIGR03557 family F420-dependent LLM class oxidoreductase [Kribbella qitaiheensis]|uniref:TIGR03557 family F420-dependent LLM class oxidoreductase n=1 Tax=Kribbella qitaiheensis TaxID=1544730 RepID=A0A7G6WS95_9ACTN|nr:TIGR03557 family F420-dependent LLM class oxidoreductase [Kribbella qitaiheensis]QNE16860.1 TIGR03557 family F420-dependent LLM class oxidoreductase [Kribbella qitaiheensis]